MSIYGIKQFRVNNFTKAAQVFTYSVSSTASINQISVSRLYLYLNYLELCYQNAVIMPRTSFSNDKLRNLDKGHYADIHFRQRKSKNETTINW